MGRGSADGARMERANDAMRARARRRNTRALAVSGGLVGFAFLCLVLFVGGFASLGASRADKPVSAVAKSTTTRSTPPPTTIPPTTTTTSTTTTVPPTTTTTTTTTTVAPPTTLPPPPPPTTTVPKRVTARVTTSNSPQFCTVTVHLSNGAFRSFPLGKYVDRPGDEYIFTAYVGGYHVDVTARVVARRNDKQCEATLGKLSR